MQVLVALASLAGTGTGLYVFEHVSTVISVESPAPEAFVGFRVENNSYMDLRDVQASCYFNQLRAGNGDVWDHVRMERRAMTDIPAGTAKVTSCGMFTEVFPILQGDVEFSLYFRVRCVPFLALCHRTVQKRF